MYFVKTGVIRLYKKKGDSQIELDTVHSGQVLGELAFLDGNPRSAAAEALTYCELIEISGPTFQQVLVQMPEWLKILLRTVVGRLRTASTRIRQLESASTQLDYNENGGRSTSYVFLSMIDVLKMGTALLLVASRNTEDQGKGPEVKIPVLTRYANQIMGIPVAKITTFLDIMTQCGILEMIDQTGAGRYTVKDAVFLEQAITYFNDENLLEPAKRHDVSLRGFLVMSLMNKHLSKATKKDDGTVVLNIAEVKKLETNEAGKEPFRMDEFNEISKLGFAGSLDVKSGSEAFSTLKPDAFTRAYKLQRLAMAIRAVNEQKGKAGR
jgi:CRP/FNR family cyclic AMP-dependent transcriptional regulator